MKLALISGLAAGAVALSSAHEVNLCQDNDELVVRSVSAQTTDGHLQVDISGDKLPVDTLAKIYIKVLGIPVVEAEIENYNPNMDKDTPLKLDLALPIEVPTYIPLDVEVRLSRTGEKKVASCVLASVQPSKLTVGATLTTSRFGISAAHVKYLFGKWMVRFEKEMPVAIDDIETRFEVFRQNLLRVLFHNQGDNTYTMAMNQFGHMTPEEFSATMLGFKEPTDKVASALRGEAPRAVHKHDGVSELPETVDWSAKGAVTDVKNQGACGSCWSFSATGALEGAYFLKTGKLVSFSEEQLVTCDHVDMGCNGGLMDNAFKFIEAQGGICSEDDFPYVSGSGKLPACKKCDVVKNSAPKSFTDVAHDEKSLMSAVAQQPVAIAIEADQFAFQFYSGGVLTGKCGARLDHGVLVVGYGTLNGIEYWKVKNSWGATWGMQGYINLQREKRVDGGECGILESASYPVM